MHTWSWKFKLLALYGGRVPRSRAGVVAHCFHCLSYFSWWLHSSTWCITPSICRPADTRILECFYKVIGSDRRLCNVVYGIATLNVIELADPTHFRKQTNLELWMCICKENMLVLKDLCLGFHGGHHTQTVILFIVCRHTLVVAASCNVWRLQVRQACDWHMLRKGKRAHLDRCICIRNQHLQTHWAWIWHEHICKYMHACWSYMYHQTCRTRSWPT